MTWLLSFMMLTFIVFCGNACLEFRRRDFHAIPVVIKTVFRPVLMVYLRRDTQDYQWRDLICLCFKRNITGTLDLNRGFLTGINSQRIRWVELSASRSVAYIVTVGTAVISEPGKGERGSLKFNRAVVMVSKQIEIALGRQERLKPRTEAGEA